VGDDAGHGNLIDGRRCEFDHLAGLSNRPPR
jgi:hypothetical protein